MIIMSASEFDLAVDVTEPGDRFCYFTGFLMRDRKAVWDFEAEPVEAIGRAAFKALEQGKVTLTQRKLADGKYQYFAVKKAEPHQPILWEGCYDTTSYPHKKPVLKDNETALGAAIKRARRPSPTRARRATDRAVPAAA